MDEIVAFDQNQNIDDFMPLSSENSAVTCAKKHNNFKSKRGGGALGGTRTPTILLTATSRQRVYQFRHERFFRIGTGLRRTASRPDRDPINGADVTNQRWRDKACERGGFHRAPGDRGSICLTSTAIRLRSTRTTPLAIGRLLARILTSSASVASSSMMAPRLRRIT